MEIDDQKVQESALGLLYLTLHDGNRAWKTLDFQTMNRLHQQGFISDPVNRVKSITFTETGLREAEAIAKRLFFKKK